MARNKKKLQDTIIQVCSPSLIFLFYSVCQSIATYMFVYFVRAYVCLSVSVDVAFYFKLGFGRDVGLSMTVYLDFGGRGFQSEFFLWGGQC